MLFRLLLLFVLVPFIELTVLLWLADITHWTYTLALIVVTGIVGTFLARSQGFRVYNQIQQELASGKMPGRSLADGAMILFAGGLLLTPGILTDIFGLSLLIPACRTFYGGLILSRLRVQTIGGANAFGASPHDAGPFHAGPFSAGAKESEPNDARSNDAEDIANELRRDRILDSYVIEPTKPDDPQ